MTVTLNHVLVGAADNDRAAQEFAEIMGLEFTGHDGPGGKFAQVRVNDTLNVDFATVPDVAPQHLAFDVDGTSFDQIITRLRERTIAFGDDPRDTTNGQITHPLAARGLFWTSSDGHLYEVMTDTP